jgi:AcrR family transcriptional regulator
MTDVDATPPRRRGRPPKQLDGPSTVERLLEAAFDACADHGFDAVSLADVAERAGVTANAVYKHFPSKSDLLLATARRAVDEVAATANVRGTLTAPDRARALMRAFLAPGASRTRRFWAELTVAAERDERLGEMLDQWNRESAERWLTLLGGRRTPLARARVKALFLLVRGTCHLDGFDAVDAPSRAVARLIEDAAASLFESR